jgi:tetratricopeptide (TPR) repeat protein
MMQLLRMLRLTAVHLALGALGCWAIWAQIAYRTPNRYVSVLLAGVAVAMTGLSLAFWLHAMFRGIGAPQKKLTLTAVGHRLCALVILGLACYGLFLFSNGRFDLADPAHYATEIVSIGLDETEVGIRVPFVWADVRSWRRPGELERILVRPDERERLWSGQAVVVSVRPGFHGVPWVSRIEGDVEKRSREVLALAPDAGQVRKDLAEFYAQLGRFTEAAMTTREYARRFPDDRAFPVRIATLLTSRERFADVVTVLDDVAPRREDADVYMLLGHALAMQGRRPEGLVLLERARGMQPRNWWPHYALGWAYGGAGDYARAVASFQKAIELRPGLNDAERELQRLRPLAARAPAR